MQLGSKRTGNLSISAPSGKLHVFDFARGEFVPDEGGDLAATMLLRHFCSVWRHQVIVRRQEGKGLSGMLLMQTVIVGSLTQKASLDHRATNTLRWAPTPVAQIGVHFLEHAFPVQPCMHPAVSLIWHHLYFFDTLDCLYCLPLNCMYCHMHCLYCSYRTMRVPWRVKLGRLMMSCSMPPPTSLPSTRWSRVASCGLTRSSRETW